MVDEVGRRGEGDEAGSRELLFGDGRVSNGRYGRREYVGGKYAWTCRGGVGRARLEIKKGDEAERRWWEH